MRLKKESELEIFLAGWDFYMELGIVGSEILAVLGVIDLPIHRVAMIIGAWVPIDIYCIIIY